MRRELAQWAQQAHDLSQRHAAGLIPVNRASGTGVGVIGQLHLYLDDMFPKTFGQPLIGGTSTTPRAPTF